MREKKFVFTFKVDKEISYDGEDKKLVVIGAPIREKDSSSNGSQWFHKGGIQIRMTSCFIVLEQSSPDFSKAFDVKFEDKTLFVKTHNKNEILLEIPTEYDDWTNQKNAWMLFKHFLN